MVACALCIGEQRDPDEGDLDNADMCVIDGASRILDPIFESMIHGNHRSGCSFKDYQILSNNED